MNGAASRRGATSGPALAGKLGHTFSDPALLREALTHPSVNPDDRGAARYGYERLEFLGDRVLGLVIAEWLLERHPTEDEGNLARRHADLVRREALAEAGRALDLGRFLRVSLGEEGSGGRENDANLANSCEALIGALYQDGGLPVARHFIRTFWREMVDRNVAPPQDPKTQLQEWAQGNQWPLPEYREVDRSGADHAPTFVIEARVRDWRAQARGSSKKTAQRKAAAALIADLRQAGAYDRR